jgi:hypothetical protein
MTEREFSISVPEEMYDELMTLDSDRLNSVMVEAVNEALSLSEDAEARREELHARRRGHTRNSEELASNESGAAQEELSEVEKKQRELKERILRGGRR